MTEPSNAEDGIATTNTIYLEGSVYLALVDWVEMLKRRASGNDRSTD